MIAVASERIELVKMLLQFGADPNIPDLQGLTTLDVLKESGSVSPNAKQINRLMRRRFIRGSTFSKEDQFSNEENYGSPRNGISEQSVDFESGFKIMKTIMDK